MPDRIYKSIAEPAPSPFQDPIARLVAAPAVETHSLRGTAAAVLLTSSMVVLALAVGMTIEHLLHIQNLLLVFLPVVIFAAVRFGFAMASWVSVLSVLATSFLAEPRYSFAVSDPSNVWALAFFLIVAAFTNGLAAQARHRTVTADYHRRTVEQLYVVNSRLAGLAERAEIAAAILAEVRTMLGLDAIIVTRENGALRIDAAPGRSISLDAPETVAAADCFASGRPTGRATGRHEAIDWQFLPLETAHGIVGLLGRPAVGEIRPPAESELLLDVIRDQAAVHLERSQLTAERRRADLLAEAEKLRSALLTSISHDLRTPLASILGNVTSLEKFGERYDSATRAEMLAHTREETLRLARFVDNLLSMSRIEAGALRPSLEPIDLSDVVGSAAARLRPALAGHRLEIAIAPDFPLVPLDFLLMEQVVVNLLANAAKYAPTDTAITVSAGLDGEKAELRVADEGPGIPDAELGRVFERFHRVAATDHRPAGTGLGLAICRGFVEAMGGSIEAMNRKDRRGAVFTIRLPLGRTAGSAAPAGTAKAAGAAK